MNPSFQNVMESETISSNNGTEMNKIGSSWTRVQSHRYYNRHI
jgi:hypothetical protein